MEWAALRAEQGRQRHSEQGVLLGGAGGRVNAACSDKIATMKF